MATIRDMMRKLENFQREIENLSGKKITIIPDTKGMLDKQCPNKMCNAFFKVNAEDWKNIMKDESVFCPFCRNKSRAQDYLPQEQHAKIIRTIRGAMMDSWKSGLPIQHQLVSVRSGEAFELTVQCEKCLVRFSVIGAAHFCPNCGHNSIERTALAAVEKIILKAEKIFEIQSALEKTMAKDEAAMIAKNILESSLSDCIGILQNFSETKYNSLSTVPAPFNAFQNVEKANKLWLTLKNDGYDTWLSANEINYLLISTQKRHLLEHKGGIVDLKYLQMTNDTNYVEGNRIVVQPDNIKMLGKIILKIIEAVNKF